jgi:hypothetical protein
MEPIFSGQRVENFELSKTIKRNIERKEKSLNRRCGKKWKFTNRLGESFIFANFNKYRDKLIITVAYWNKNINKWLPCY